MQTYSKICDAADWFDAELQRVIDQELQEPARFHRKQWEFAMIFHTLQKQGFLTPDATGLSLGGGNERVLYSIARHINKLIVTDLYEEDTSWDTARTGDPNEFIRKSKPFPVDNRKLEAQRMDMRYLEFPDNTFDFCYSSCAIEHIGEYQDFLQHFREVYRVLNEGGIYVFTTEFHFGDETIKDPHNYIFAADYLRHLLEECPLTLVAHPHLEITHHAANQPLPANIHQLVYSGESLQNHPVEAQTPHIQLLRGKYPFTSILFILRKEENSPPNDLRFPGFTSAKAFLDVRVDEYRTWVEKATLSINPFSSLPRGISRFFQDHADFFRDDTNPPDEDDPTIFHSDYFWLGSGDRTFSVEISGVTSLASDPAELTVKIHRYATLKSDTVECVTEEKVVLDNRTNVTVSLTAPLADDYCYAVLAHRTGGDFRLGEVRITSQPLAVPEKTSRKRDEINYEHDAEESWT